MKQRVGEQMRHRTESISVETRIAMKPKEFGPIKTSIRQVHFLQGGQPSPTTIHANWIGAHADKRKRERESKCEQLKIKTS